jgi:hypothetical protein
MAWMRIVDYAVQPSMAGTTNESFLYPQPQSGAFVLVTAVKKAWLQSSPWILVSLVLLVLCWMKRDTFARILGSERQAELRLLSMVVIPTLGMFSATGPTRTDGLCFNQRYFCELVPLLAVAFAWATGGIWHRRQWLLGGGLLGAGIAFAALQPHPLAPLRHYLVMYVPLAAAIASAAVWAHFVRRPERTGAARALAFAAGASLAWALTIHVGDDVQASRTLRESRLDYRRQISPYLEGATAVFAGGPIRDALGPLLLERDVVIATPVLDRGATTRDLIDAFLARGRRVFLLPNVLPPDSLNDAIAGKQARFLGEPKLLLEVRQPQGEG